MLGNKVSTDCQENGVAHVPYDISTLQKICTPRRPIVSAGKLSHVGPSIRDAPLNFRWTFSPPPETGAKPVMDRQLRPQDTGTEVLQCHNSSSTE